MYVNVCAVTIYRVVIDKSDILAVCSRKMNYPFDYVLLMNCNINLLRYN